MAFALVGVTGAEKAGGANTAVTPAYGQTPTAGNLLVLWVLGQGAATLPAAPSGWSIAIQEAGTSSSASIFYKIAAGSDAAPTVAAITSTVLLTNLVEFSGNVSASPLDQTAVAAGTTSPLVATCGAADGSVGDLLVAAIGTFNSSATVLTTQTSAFNNGISSQFHTNAGSSVNHYHFTYAFGTGNAAADTCTFTLAPTTTLTGISMAVASFKSSAAPIIPVAAHSTSGGTMLLGTTPQVTGTAGSTSSATLAATAQTQIGSLSTAPGTSSALAAVSAQTQIATNPSVATSSATLALSAPTQLTGLSTATATSNATAVITVATIPQITGSASSTSNATATITVSTQIVPSAATATSTATLSLTAANQLQPATATGSSAGNLTIGVAAQIVPASNAGTSFASAIVSTTAPITGIAVALSDATATIGIVIARWEGDTGPHWTAGTAILERWLEGAGTRWN